LRTRSVRRISLGGDSDTIAAITGAIAEAYYGVPDWIKNKALSYLDADCGAFTTNGRLFTPKTEVISGFDKIRRKAESPGFLRQKDFRPKQRRLDRTAD
jgi:hypothetical protein